MNSRSEVVSDYLTAKNLRYSRTEDCTSFTVCYRLNHTCVTCTIHVDEESRYLSCSTRSGIIVAEDKFEAAAEYVARANYGLGIGAFQIDYEDGDFCLRTSLYAGASELSPQMIRHLLRKNVNSYDFFHPGIVDVLYRDVAPARALEKVKQEKQPRCSQEDIDAVVSKLMGDMEEPHSLSGPSSPGPLLSDFDHIKARVEQNPDGVLLPMKELVSASGQRRAGKHIVRRIEESLRAYGLGHEPANLPHSQTELVRVFKKEDAE